MNFDDKAKDLLKAGWNIEDSIAEKKFKDIFGDLFKD